MGHSAAQVMRTRGEGTSERPYIHGFKGTEEEEEEEEKEEEEESFFRG